MRNLKVKNWKQISDADYIQGLKGGDDLILQSFFYGLCSNLLSEIQYSLMNGSVDYDELVSELFLYLSDNNWHKLDTYAGLNGCSLFSWLTRVTWRYFLKKREYLLGQTTVDLSDVQIETKNQILEQEIKIDVETTLEKIPNKKYVQLLQWMILEGYSAEDVATMFKTTTANVYNIKHRAIIQFVDIYNKS